jgi:hypothetical protein
MKCLATRMLRAARGNVRIGASRGAVIPTTHVACWHKADNFGTAPKLSGVRA